MDKPANKIADTRARKIIFLLCLLAAVHVFIFSAAFPFFNNVDEQIHFDLTVKYAQGRLPLALESVSNTAVNYIVLYSSSAYVGSPTNYPDGQFSPAAVDAAAGKKSARPWSRKRLPGGR